MQAGIAWPDPRFTDNGDGTVTDTLTGLMWLKDGACLGRKSWHNALNTIGSFNNTPEQYKYICPSYKGTFSDWRMPDIKELESLIHYGVANSSSWLNMNGFSNVKSALYWTATTAVNASQALGVMMTSGALSAMTKANNRSGSYFITVRSTGSESPYKVPESGQNISYAPGDDADEQSGGLWPEPRFTDNGDGTVTDNLTGLMWLKDGVCLGKQTWDDALSAIGGLNANPEPYNCDGYSAEYTNWRMPNIRELESLINFGASDSSLWLNSNGFSDIKPAYYWTSTGNQNAAWLVDVRKAFTTTMRKTSTTNTRKTTTYNVIAVRDAE
jgi:hypothetical protein